MGREEHPRAGPEEALEERRQVVRRALRALPDEMLSALVRGLSRHADQLAPGRLFRSAGGGGCAVGVMLRELQPELYATGRLRFWLRHSWRTKAGSYGATLEAQPRLRHLEWSFDEAVLETRRLDRRLSCGDAARRVGAWFADEAREELRWRDLSRGFTGPAAAIATTGAVASR